MAGPFDYTIQQPNIAGSILGGIQAGQQIQASREAQEAQQAAQAQAEQYKADLQSYLSNPTAQGAAAMSAKYPGQREALKQSWDIQSKDQQDANFRAGTQVISAIESGRPEIAMQVIDDQIAAMENSGQDPSSLKQIREAVQRDPKSAGASIALTLSSLDPDKWGKIASERRESAIAPAKLSEAEAKAKKAGVEANFAESKAVQDLAKTGWEINKLQNDIGISRQNSQIAALNANIAREGNDIKRQEMQLKLQDRLDKREDAIRATTAKIENVRSTIDNSLSTIDRVLKNPALDSVIGAVEGSDLYPSTLVGLLPGTASSDDRANALADIDTLKSQTFLTSLQAMKEASTTGASGLGGLTEKEGDRLINGVQSLRAKQGEKQFKENMAEVQRLLLKNRENLAKKYGVPDVIPDRPNLQSQPASSGFKVLGVE